MRSKYFIWIAVVLWLFTLFGKYSGYNISESIVTNTYFVFLAVIFIAFMLKSKGK